jgi:hypothetical protein
MFLPEDGNNMFLQKVATSYRTKWYHNKDDNIFAAAETSALLLSIYIFP